MHAWIPGLLTCFLVQTAGAQQQTFFPGVGTDFNRLEDSSMEGRVTGTRGSRLAQFFLIGRLQQTGASPFAGTYEQPFFFERDGKRIMGTNLTALDSGSSRQIICVAAPYGSDSLPDDPQNAASSAILLEVAAYFRLHPMRHALVAGFTDGNAGIPLFPGPANPDIRILVELEAGPGNRDSAWYQNGPGPGLGVAVAGAIAGIPVSLLPAQGPGTGSARVPTMHYRFGFPGPAENRFSTARQEQACRDIIRLLTQLDRSPDPGMAHFHQKAWSRAGLP